MAGCWDQCCGGLINIGQAEGVYNGSDGEEACGGDDDPFTLPDNIPQFAQVDFIIIIHPVELLGVDEYRLGLWWYGLFFLLTAFCHFLFVSSFRFCFGCWWFLCVLFS